MTRNEDPARPFASEPRTTSLAARVGWWMVFAAALGMIALIAVGRLERDRSDPTSAEAAAERRAGAVEDGSAGSATPSGAGDTLSPAQSSAPRIGPAAGAGDTLPRRAAPPSRHLESAPAEGNEPRPAPPTEGEAEEPRL